MNTKETLINMAHRLNELNKLSGDTNRYAGQLALINRRAKYNSKFNIIISITIATNDPDEPIFINFYFENSMVDERFWGRDILNSPLLPKELKLIIIDNLDLMAFQNEYNRKTSRNSIFLK